MDSGVKDLLLSLLIGIVATAVGSGSLFVLGVFLWRLGMKWWSHGRTPDAGSGDQPLPQADALRDVEMGPIWNGGEAVDHPSGVAANGSIPHQDDGGMQRGRITGDMADGSQIHGVELLCSSRQPVTNASASGVQMAMASLNAGEAGLSQNHAC